MVEIIKYSPQNKLEWDTFVKGSKNGTFLFQRDFMEYHSDRFEDFSLLCYYKGRLKAVLPANIKDEVLYSHQGLTYGGLVLESNVKFDQVISIFKSLLYFLSDKGIQSLYLKLIPSIYFQSPSDEVLGLIKIVEATLLKQEVSLGLDYNNKLNYSTNKKRTLKKAEKSNFEIRQTESSKVFFDQVLIPNLRNKFGVAPVHTLDEIELLKSNFPNNIYQYNVLFDEKVVAGILVFETETVIHAQYISGMKEFNNLGAIDYLTDYLIQLSAEKEKFFNLGVSSEQGGAKINEGLLNWKLGFGTFPVIHSTYKIETASFEKLEQLFV